MSEKSPRLEMKGQTLNQDSREPFLWKLLHAPHKKKEKSLSGIAKSEVACYHSG